MFTTLFFADASERAIKTIAQAVLSLLVVGDEVFNILSVNWTQAMSVALSAGFISILMSIISYKATSSNSASLVVDAEERL